VGKKKKPISWKTVAASKHRPFSRKELTFHWLRMPSQDRLNIAEKLKLVTLDEITSSKRPIDLHLKIIDRAIRTNVAGKLWKHSQAYRKKWGLS
jgi:hypothetical protein